MLNARSLKNSLAEREASKSDAVGERGRIIAEFGNGSRVELGTWLIGREWTELTLVVLDDHNREMVRRYYRLRGTSLWNDSKGLAEGVESTSRGAGERGEGRRG